MASDDAVQPKAKKGHPFRNGLLWGLLIGGGLALLFAPRPGKQTRAALREQFNDFPDRLDEFQATAREAAIDLNTVFTNWRSAKVAQVQGAFEAGREAADTARQDLQREYGQRLAGSPPPGEAGGPPPDMTGAQSRPTEARQAPDAPPAASRPFGNGAANEPKPEG
jgi:gas vesicle protein